MEKKVSDYRKTEGAAFFLLKQLKRLDGTGKKLG